VNEEHRWRRLPRRFELPSGRIFALKLTVKPFQQQTTIQGGVPEATYSRWFPPRGTHPLNNG
jgi:hypothetical protein